MEGDWAAEEEEEEVVVTGIPARVQLQPLLLLQVNLESLYQPEPHSPLTQLSPQLEALRSPLCGLI